MNECLLLCVLDFYEPICGLREGNVFSRVCLSVVPSVQGRGYRPHQTPCPLDLFTWERVPWPVQICSLRGPPSRPAGKWTFGIQLKGLLVLALLVVLSCVDLDKVNRIDNIFTLISIICQRFLSLYKMFWNQFFPERANAHSPISKYDWSSATLCCISTADSDVNCKNYWERKWFCQGLIRVENYCRKWWKWSIIRL